MRLYHNYIYFGIICGYKLPLFHSMKILYTKLRKNKVVGQGTLTEKEELVCSQ